tara:strand:- start:3799 stop:4410 length:612 start_codon:yes stop_codon:yes gene_type:complete
MSKKPVIVFEGIEGSGKTSHIRNVSNYLRKNKIDFIKLREPGGSFNSERIRNLILNKKLDFNKNTDLFLYLAARSENIQVLKNNYKKKIILIDRFTDSTIAYQHYGFGINLKMIDTLNKYLLKKFKVDFTFLNIVNEKNLKIRLKKRKRLNRYDNFKIRFYNKVQSGYLKLSKKNKNYLVVDSNLNMEENKKKIIFNLKKLIK